MIDPRELPEGTLQLYGDDPRRQAFYEALVDSRLQASPPDQESLDVILTMGAPGSGKSHALAILDACQEGVVMVDPDLFKNVLVEYRVAKAAHDRLAADRVHRESSMLAKKLRDAAIASRRDLCIDGVMSKRDTALELIQRLQSHGYDVTIVAAVVPFETAYERVLSRGEATGRFVPYEYAKQAHANIEAHRDELLRAANRGYAFDTSGSVDEQPQLIAQYEAGKPVVVNQ
jgi:predicted ABC-type ATPase